MKKNQKRMIALAIAMATSPLYAGTVSEIEANQPIASAQYLTISDQPITIDGAIGSPDSFSSSTTTSTTSISLFGPAPTLAPAPTTVDDVDFYSFYAQAGDVITLNIDGAYDDVSKTGVDTSLAVFDADYNRLRENDDTLQTDAGSNSLLDARIDNFKVEKSGIYYVGVVAYPRSFTETGGNVVGSSSGSGTYKLVISGVSPSAHQISLDVKPGSSDRAPINPKSKGKITVALLSDSSFNAMDIDQSTLTFGKTGYEHSLSKCNPVGQDVNGDGLLDLICHFDNQAANFDYGSLEGIARGSSRSTATGNSAARAVGGMAFEGHGQLKVVPTLTK